MKKVMLYIFLTFGTTLSYAHIYKVNSEMAMKNIIAQLNAGDEVIIANGSYENWSITIPSQGTAKKPILISAETEGKVLFTGEVSQTLFKFTGSYVRLRGISFINCTLVKATGKTGILVELKSTNHVVIEQCTFINNRAKSQFMPLVVVAGNGTSNQIAKCTFRSNIDNQDVQVKITKEDHPLFTVIEHNLFTDKQKVSWANQNGGECIQIGQDPVLLGNIAAKTMVRFNTFKMCNAEGEVISNKSSNNSYLNNYFEDNDGELVMRGGHDCRIEGNTFEGGTGGIRINGTGHRIVHNKINHVKTAIRLMYGMAKGKEEVGFYIAASNCTLKDNEIKNASTGILIGDSKNIDWTGKFDTVKYPSRVLQDIAPFNNIISGNKTTATKVALTDLTL